MNLTGACGKPNARLSANSSAKLTESTARTSRVDDYNRKADAHNSKVVSEINRRLNATSTSVTYRPAEQKLVERVHEAINFEDGREYDVFLSYARIDAEDVASALAKALEDRGVRVWFDAVAI